MDNDLAEIHSEIKSLASEVATVKKNTSRHDARQTSWNITQLLANPFVTVLTGALAVLIAHEWGWLQQSDMNADVSIRANQQAVIRIETILEEKVLPDIILNRQDINAIRDTFWSIVDQKNWVDNVYTPSHERYEQRLSAVGVVWEGTTDIAKENQRELNRINEKLDNGPS